MPSFENSPAEERGCAVHRACSIVSIRVTKTPSTKVKVKATGVGRGNSPAGRLKLVKRLKARDKAVKLVQLDDRRVQKLIAKDRRVNNSRPTDYTVDLANQICHYITEGKSLRTIGLIDGMPDAGTILRWIATYDNFRQQYEKATETRAHARFEKIDDTLEEMKAGTLDALKAKVCLDAIKWQCGKENAKRYTDVTRVAHTDTHGNDIEKLPDADLDNEINRLVINIGIQVVVPQK
jgi:hypothetical protein